MLYNQSLKFYSDFTYFCIYAQMNRFCDPYLTHIYTNPISITERPHVQLEQFLHRAKNQILEYLSGERIKFDLNYKLTQGTVFEQKVWTELSKIPYGKTISYKDIALKLNHKMAYRAVGNANNKNPLMILIPCHRVISHSGKLCGYAGGIELK